MDENKFSGLFLPAAAGFFSFLRKPHSESKHAKHNEKSPVLSDDGSTGVSRYIKNQLSVLDISARCRDQVLLSGVAKYILDQERYKLSKVARYVLRVKLAEKQIRKSRSVETGFDRYLKNQPVLPKVTGVSKYLKNQGNFPKVSGVSKYMLRLKYSEQSILTTQTLVVKDTRVSKYVKQQQIMPKFTSVSKYLVRQSLLDKADAKKRSLSSVKITGVARYMQKQQALPKKSGVEKYIKMHAGVVEQPSKAPETTVEKYIRGRN